MNNQIDERINKKERVLYTPPPDLVPGMDYECGRDYDLVVADPPWKGPYGTENHYDTMEDDEIINMPVSSLVADDSVLFLWIPNSKLPFGFEVIKAWGFSYRTPFTWFKPGIGRGDPLRNSTELFLVGVRGHPKPAFRGQPNCGYFPRQEHSHKPEEIYAVAERLYPDAKYLELFARKRPSNPKWDIWGKQAEGGSDIYIPGYPAPEYSDRVRFFVPQPKEALC